MNLSKLLSRYLGIFSIMTCLSMSAQEGKIVSLPQSLTVHEGQQFEILLMVHPGVEPVTVVDLMLAFDTNYLTVISIDKADSPLNLNQVEPRINQEDGTLFYGAFKLTKPWPEQPFELVSIQLRAEAPVEHTSVRHVREGNPKSLMAYAGRNTMKHAPDIELRILPKTQKNSNENSRSESRLEVNCDTTPNQCTIAFESSEKTNTVITLKEKEGAFEKLLFDYPTHSGETYLFHIDTSVLNSGNYTIASESSESRHTYNFSTTH